MSVFSVTSYADWPKTFHETDPENGVLVDSTFIPLQNTCQEPLKIEIDQESVRGGVAVNPIITLGKWVGDNVHTYYSLRYFVTCGNGVKYRGFGLWEDPYDNGQEGETSAEGGNGWFYSNTFPTHEYAGHGPVFVDPKTMEIRNMWFEFHYGTKKIWQEIGWKNGWKKVPIDDIKAKWIGKTVKLPAYSGGVKRLERPVVFVHGLDMDHVDTWGVRGPECTLIPESVIPASSPMEPKIGWDTSSNVSYGVFDLNLTTNHWFTGRCKEDPQGINWKSPRKSLLTLSVAPEFESSKKDLISMWIKFAKGHPPVLRALEVRTDSTVGELELWVPWDYLKKNQSLKKGMKFGNKLEIYQMGSSGLVRTTLSFRFPASDVNWDHTPTARAFVGSKGIVDSSGKGKDPYESGTAPDLIARLRQLKKGAEINRNGIYFFNGYRWNADSGKMIQPLPWWKEEGKYFVGEPGESWTLYKYLESVLNIHYGEGWRTDSSKTLDLVCHSQGGISLREMLANAGGISPYGRAMPQGAANAANHIRKAVTVNTPHFGAVSTTSLEKMPSDYMESYGPILIDSARTDINLVDVTITPTMMGRYLASKAAVLVSDDLWWDYCKRGDIPGNENGETRATLFALSPVVPLVAGIGAALADYRIHFQGSWMKADSMEIGAVWKGQEISFMKKEMSMAFMHDRVFSGRRKGEHLGFQSDAIRVLGQSYPQLPDGRDLELQPLYSTIGGMGKLAREILADNLGGDLCDFSGDMRQASCYGFARSFEHGASVDKLVDNVKLELPWMDFLARWQAGYLSRTDITVDEQSQKAQRKDGIWESEKHPGKLHEPLSYGVRKFQAHGRFPDTLAPHGELGISFDTTFLRHRFRATPSVIGAPRLGYDIYCALAPDCSELLSQGGRIARLPEGERQALVWNTNAASRMAIADTVTVVGDFQLGVMPLGKDILGYQVRKPSGEVLLEVAADTTAGLQAKAHGFTESVVPAGYLVRPNLRRTGNFLWVEATTWAGQKISKKIRYSWLPDSLVVAAISEDSTGERPLLVGTFHVDTLLRDPTPDGQVRVWFREARGADTLRSLPRVVVENTGRKPVKGVELFYTFRADPMHPPVLEVPNGTPWELVPRGGDLWDLHYRDAAVEIAAGGAWTSPVQAQLALRMTNFAAWDVFKDPSNDRNFGQWDLNPRIQVRDGQGAVLWGRRMENQDPERPTVRKIMVWTQESAVNETNVTKPVLRIRNMGNAPLSGLQATWVVRLPSRAKGVLERWYLPDNGQASLEALGGGLWAIRWRLPRWIQPGQSLETGNLGVHLLGWQAWDRSLSPSHFGVDGQWAANPWVMVQDDSGHVLWGNLPPDLKFTHVKDTAEVVDTTPLPLPLRLQVELRDEAPTEFNAAKPRVRVTNLGQDTIHQFTLAFPFQTERDLAAMSFLWFPGNECGLSLEANSRAVLKCQDLSIAPGAVWPDASGAVFGLYHTDWSAWDKSNDPAFATMTPEFTVSTTVQVLP